MIKTTNELKLELTNYSNFNTKINRLVKEGKLLKIKKGIYETNDSVNPFYLTNILYGPSYISFQSVLSLYGLIPERVYSITCATLNKHKSKIFKNTFGTFVYKDVPESVYPYAVDRINENGYCYYIAKREKALCDLLYEYSPINSIKEFKALLFEDLRLNEEEFENLDMSLLVKIAELYNSTNTKFLIKFLRRDKYVKWCIDSRNE